MKTSARANRIWEKVAFSLIELLVVIAIIVILAAMLLPVLNRGKMRAKQIQCVNNLREMGLAFNSFAHDHESRFPMQVSTNSGGAMEYVQRGYLISGEFDFTFRIFQTISNELVAVQHLICPADTRTETNTFGNVQNANLSYFVGVNAQPVASTLVLAGDRNISPEMVPPVSIYHLYSSFLEWSRDGHRFKGNLLFADSHVEQTKSPVLRQDINQNSKMADVFMPSVKGGGASTSGPPPDNGGGPGSGGPGGGGGSGGNGGNGGSGGSGGSTPPVQPQRPANPILANSPPANKPADTPAAPWSPTEKQNPGSSRPLGGAANGGNGDSSGVSGNKSPFTNHPTPIATVKTNAEQTSNSSVDPLLAAAPHYLAQGNNWLLWLLVLLIALFLLTLEIRRRMDARAKRKAKFGINID
jgi:prepilin-type N-terminal cleavage/methylation domain-containing protein/prepilin-type processing-associated H-X9-DG protein